MEKVLNPFANGYVPVAHGKRDDSVRQLIEDQLKDMEVHYSMKIDNKGNPDGFRKGISKYGKLTGKAFRTQKDVNGDTWVLRIS